MDKTIKGENPGPQETGPGNLSPVLSGGPLAPYCGGVRNHQPSSFVRWEEAEDEEGLSRYISQYHNPALPPRLHLDGEWGYHFNSLGFRGEEFNPGARFRLYVCGCSYSYGMGIKWEHTFGYVFKERLAHSYSCDIADINLMNFSQQAASNDYIVRTCLMQCARTKPDLLLVLFTSKERFEYVDESQTQNIGPWISSLESLAYYRFYSEHIGMINMLKNILLLQSMCQHWGIQYLFSIFHHNELLNPLFRENPIVGSLVERLDWNFITPFSLADFRCDVGRMGHHPGPLSNLWFGRKLFVFYQRAFSSSMPENRSGNSSN